MGIVVLSDSLLPLLVRAILFTAIQLAATGFKLTRPFSHTKDNIIEGVNDFVLFSLALTFTVCRDESSWEGDTLSDVVVAILVFNGLFVHLLIIAD
jgi:hypothetical protein